MSPRQVSSTVTKLWMQVTLVCMGWGACISGRQALARAIEDRYRDAIILSPDRSKVAYFRTTI